jgi:hypothetical protein
MIHHQMRRNLINGAERMVPRPEEWTAVDGRCYSRGYCAPQIDPLIGRGPLKGIQTVDKTVNQNDCSPVHKKRPLIQVRKSS